MQETRWKNAKIPSITMSTLPKFRVLNTFVPFLRLITAFSCDQFRSDDWRCCLHSIFYAFSATGIIIITSLWIVLIVWYLIENEANLLQLVIAAPVLVSTVQLELAFIESVIRNPANLEIIDQLQRVVDEREPLVFLCMVFFIASLCRM